MPADTVTETVTLDREQAKGLLVELWAMVELEEIRADCDTWYSKRLGQACNRVAEAMFPDREEWDGFSEELFYRASQRGKEMWREFVGPLGEEGGDG